jgi:hypothetical protein
MMKLLPLLLLAFVLSLGVACSSEDEPKPPCRETVSYPAGHRCAPEPTPTPEPTPAPKYSEGEVIGLVQGMLRSHPDEACNNVLSYRYEFRATWSTLPDGDITGERWMVVAQTRKDSGKGYDVIQRRGTWYVYEGTNAIRAPYSC